MAFPDEPSVPLPTWATDSGAIKVDPGDTKRGEGWTYAGVGVQYGEAPPFPWVNNEAYNNGQWASYFKDCMDYIKAGNTSLRGIVLSMSAPITFTGGSAYNFTIPADTVNYVNSSGSLWNTSSYTFTAPETSLYCFQLNTPILHNSSLTDTDKLVKFKTTLRINGIQISKISTGISQFEITDPTVTGAYVTVVTNAYYQLNAGNTVNFLYSASSPATISSTVVSGQTLFISWNL